MDILNKTITLNKDTKVFTTENGEVILPAGTVLRVAKVNKTGVVMETVESEK